MAGWLHEEFLNGDVFGKALAKERIIGGILQQATHKVRHAGNQFAKRRINADAMPAFQKQLSLLVTHSIEHLDFHRSRGDVQFLRQRQSMRQTAKVVARQSGPQPLMVFHQQSSQALVAIVRLPLAAIDGNRPATVFRDDVFVVPVSAFDQSNPDGCSALLCPFEHAVEIVFSRREIRLNHDAAIGIVAELVFHHHATEDLERDFAVIVLFHVDLNVGLILPRGSQHWTQSG